MTKVVSTKYANAPFEGGTGIAYTFVLAGLLVTAILFGSLSMKKPLHPIYVMTQTARSTIASDLNVHIDKGNLNDESDKLARAFNEILDCLEKAYRKQNRFISGALYELCTLLSVISGYVNLLHHWGSEDPVMPEESVIKIIEGTGNIQQLIERLLFLAQVGQRM